MTRHWRKLLLVAAMMAGVLAVFASAGSATTSVTLFVATKGTNTTNCTSASYACETIQDAITEAEGPALTGTSVTIEVAAGTYKENDTIDDPTTQNPTLTIAGSAVATTTVSGVSDTVITIDAGTVTIERLTITGGETDTMGAGGGIYNAGSVSLTNDTITGNSDDADGGAGMYNDGTATLTDDTVSDNTAPNGSGGALANTSTGTVTLNDDTLSGNSGGYYGGAIYNYGSATLSDDTLFDNSAGYDGGAIFNNGPATSTNDTFFDNSAPESGGAIDNYGSANLTDDTLSNNSASAGGGVAAQSGGGEIAVITNSIVDASPCAGTILDGEYNVESDNSCDFSTSYDLVNNGDINLATSLAANGSSGPQTLAIGTNSSAFEEVPAGDCTVSTDERGDPRPGVSGKNCDAGAFEYQPVPTVSAVSPDKGPTTGGTAITITGTGFVSGATVEIGQGNGTTGAINATNVKVVSPSEITATTGGGAKAGGWNLFVTNAGGTSAVNSGDTFTYTNPVPTVSTVNPDKGPTTGGTAITITGTGFVSGATVEIGQGNGTTGAVFASDATVVSSTKITATTGGGAKAGGWNLFVTTSGGTSAVNSEDSFTYTNPVPSVSTVNPDKGPTTGGTAITITGTGFVSGATVVIGQGNGTTGAIATTNVKVVSSTEITATTGGGAKAGTWNLFVTTAGGTSVANTGDDFTY